MLGQKESRGADYREDYPKETSEFNLNLVVNEKEKGLQIRKE